MRSRTVATLTALIFPAEVTVSSCPQVLVFIASPYVVDRQEVRNVILLHELPRPRLGGRRVGRPFPQGRVGIGGFG